MQGETYYLWRGEDYEQEAYKTKYIVLNTIQLLFVFLLQAAAYLTVQAVILVHRVLCMIPPFQIQVQAMKYSVVLIVYQAKWELEVLPKQHLKPQLPLLKLLLQAKQLLRQELPQNSILLLFLPIVDQRMLLLMAIFLSFLPPI